VVVDELVGKLTRLRVQAFAETPQTNLVELGLSPPVRVVRLAADVPPAQTNPASAAASAPAGTPASAPNELLLGYWPPERGSVFARFADGDAVFTMDSGPVRPLMAVDPLVFRERTMLAVPPSGIRRLSLVKQGAEQTVALDETGKWRAVAPAAREVVPDAIESVLFAVSNLRALRIESLNPEGPTAYGLEPAAATLTMGLTGEEGIKKSIIMGSGAGTEGVYAMVQGQDMVFVLDRSVAAQLTAELVEPVPSQAPGPAPERPTEKAP
jgi:hypothetical protein